MGISEIGHASQAAGSDPGRRGIIDSPDRAYTCVESSILMVFHTPNKT